MSKVYLVISCCGEYEEYTETVEKAFKDIKKAEDYIYKLEQEDKGYRDAAEKCRECAGLNHECPLYSITFSTNEECENYNPYYDNKTFRIDETELIS